MSDNKLPVDNVTALHPHVVPRIAMTAEEVGIECAQLHHLLGRQAHVSAAVSSPSVFGPLSIVLYPHGLTGGDRRHFWATNWPQAFRQAREWAEGYAAGVRP